MTLSLFLKEKFMNRIRDECSMIQTDMGKVCIEGENIRTRGDSHEVPVIKGAEPLVLGHRDE